ncbi:HNH endonuclease [Rhizobium sp. MHM7A]|uniref:HNH endonuclease n=1 Tax=Rhizobium sp. MHM7A TaxID=2583233 RepID=UPI001106B3EA|nr:HNH endonuclease [Rhizobium sp. MHM7A]TLX17219.1 HNH endonuclease [Rhizobium sp. MHM7A]
MTIHPGQFPALILNADFQPLSLYPLSTWSWMDAVKAVWLDRVITVAEYDRTIPHPVHEIKFPSVIALKEYQQVSRAIAFNRYNIWLRDGGVCQYCATEVTTRDFTFDHVIPRSRGGGTTWENIVCSCQPCNTFKANRTPKEAKMTLLTEPRKPRPYEIAVRQRTIDGTQALHQDWLSFIYWDVPLEK